MNEQKDQHISEATLYHETQETKALIMGILIMRLNEAGLIVYPLFP